MSEGTLASSKRQSMTSRRYESLAGYLMAAPALIVLLVFMVTPIVGALILVFMDYSILEPPEFIGLSNISRLFRDTRVWTCYRNSLLITIGAVVGNNVLGLLLAMGVNREMGRVFKYLFRTAYFFPVITTTSSLALIWRFILTRDRGVMNWLLGQFGIAPVAWLSHPEWAIRSVILYDVWKSCGYLMVYYLAGLQGIPRSLYEAARIDGANSWQLTRHITMPLISPTAFFCLIISSIGAFQIFDNAYVLTQGGPADASRTIAMYIYEMGFKRFEMGYAATVSLSLLAILVTLTLVQNWFSAKWVHYD
ncbi:MAG: sugar ABC transporter permease [Chloroflexi bacterium]|nr:sugar ABC transporter permease [Chloroflexota bacterium]